MRRFLRAVFVAPIRFYRRFLSPLKPPMCRFDPTCSSYAIEAVEKRGIFVGSALATWRILRCQPFSKPGHDPVPETGFGWGPPENAGENAVEAADTEEAANETQRSE